MEVRLQVSEVDLRVVIMDEFMDMVLVRLILIGRVKQNLKG